MPCIQLTVLVFSRGFVYFYINSDNFGYILKLHNNINGEVYNEKY